MYWLLNFILDFFILNEPNVNDLLPRLHRTQSALTQISNQLASLVQVYNENLNETIANLDYELSKHKQIRVVGKKEWQSLAETCLNDYEIQAKLFVENFFKEIQEPINNIFTTQFASSMIFSIDIENFLLTERTIELFNISRLVYAISKNNPILNELSVILSNDPIVEDLTNHNIFIKTTVNTLVEDDLNLLKQSRYKKNIKIATDILVKHSQKYAIIFNNT